MKIHSKSRPKSHSRRSELGMSLLGVLSLGIAAIAWSFIACEFIVPAYLQAANTRYETALRAATEAGLDYVVAKLNAAYSEGAVPAEDDINQDSQAVPVPIPSDVIGSTGATVVASVFNVQPDSSFGALYTSTTELSWENGGRDRNGNNLYEAPGYRVVTVTATYAMLSKTIRCVLEPMFGSTTTSSSSRPYFRQAITTANTAEFDGNNQTDGYEKDGTLDPYGGSIASNKEVKLDGSNNSIGGSIIVNSKPTTTPSKDVVIANDTTNAVWDQVIANEHIDSCLTGTPGVTPLPTDNVKAQGGGTALREDSSTAGDIVAARNRNSNPVHPLQENQSVLIPPAPSPPSSAAKLGNLILDENTTLLIEDGAPAIPSLDGSTIKILPGDYVVSNIDIRPGSQIRVAAGTKKPINFYIQGEAPSRTAFKIDGNAIQNQTLSASNLRIIYNGSKEIAIKQSTPLYALVYAPGAKVKTYTPVNFYGAIVAGSLESYAGSAWHYDKQLKDPTFSRDQGLTYTLVSQGPALTGFRVVTWQEL